jgi:hypothetical protein
LLENSKKSSLIERVRQTLLTCLTQSLAHPGTLQERVEDAAIAIDSYFHPNLGIDQSIASHQLEKINSENRLIDAHITEVERSIEKIALDLSNLTKNWCLPHNWGTNLSEQSNN